MEILKKSSGLLRLWLERLAPGARRRRHVMDAIQYQRWLLRAGFETSATVLAVDSVHAITPHWVEVRLHLRLAGRTASDRQTLDTRTVIETTRQPRTGDLLTVRYVPGDASAILVL